MSATLDYALQAPWKRLVNRVLSATPQAMTRLARFAGRTAEFRSGPLRLRLTVAADGSVDIAATETPADLSVAAAPAVLARLARGDAAAIHEADFSGDTEFGQEVAYLARNLEWDVEEDLSRVVGDIAAHRIASGVRALRGWQREAAQRLGDNVREYLTEERPALVPRRDAEDFSRDVDALRDAVARLEKRVQKQAARGN